MTTACCVRLFFTAQPLVSHAFTTAPRCHSTSNESFQTKIDESVTSERVDEPPFYEKTDEERRFISDAVRLRPSVLRFTPLSPTPWPWESPAADHTLLP